MGLFSRCRCGEVEEKLASLKREFTALELEWSNAYDKLRQIVQRIAKRSQALEALEAPGGERAENGAVPPVRQMSTRERIQQQILDRRKVG